LARRRLTGRSFTRGSSRARYAWVPGEAIEQVILGSATNVSGNLLENYVVDSGRDVGPGYTIERILGHVVVKSGTPGDGSNFYMGLLVQAENVNISSILPRSEIGRFLWWYASSTPSMAIETAAGVFDAWELRIDFDVKGRQRLLNMGDELRLISTNGASSPTVAFDIYTRTLIRVGS